MQRVLITGVSSGIGLSLTKEYLSLGWQVYGLSRREPVLDSGEENFTFASCDLSDFDRVGECLDQLLEGATALDLAILNAGVLSPMADMVDVTIAELKRIMDINLWSNKMILDFVLRRHQVSQVVTMSSGASVNGHRGWNGYSISKAALNMLTKLYAAEFPDIHFCALAPGLVDTAMQETLCSLPSDERFLAVEVLKSRRGTDAMPTPEQAARLLVRIIKQLLQVVSSGEYADIRNPPLSAI